MQPCCPTRLWPRPTCTWGGAWVLVMAGAPLGHVGRRCAGRVGLGAGRVGYQPLAGLGSSRPASCLSCGARAWWCRQGAPGIPGAAASTPRFAWAWSVALGWALLADMLSGSPVGLWLGSRRLRWVGWPCWPWRRLRARLLAGAEARDSQGWMLWPRRCWCLWCLRLPTGNVWDAGTGPVAVADDPTGCCAKSWRARRREHHGRAQHPVKVAFGSTQIAAQAHQPGSPGDAILRSGICGDRGQFVTTQSSLSACWLGIGVPTARRARYTASAARCGQNGHRARAGRHRDRADWPALPAWHGWGAVLQQALLTPQQGSPDRGYHPCAGLAMVVEPIHTQALRPIGEVFCPSGQPGIAPRPVLDAAPPGRSLPVKQPGVQVGARLAVCGKMIGLRHGGSESCPGRPTSGTMRYPPALRSSGFCGFLRASCRSTPSLLAPITPLALFPGAGIRSENWTDLRSSVPACILR